MAGFIAPFLLYAAMLLLHVLLPSRQVQGYVLDLETGRPLNYRLNGLLTFFVVLALWLVADLLGWIKWDWLYLHRWSALAGACTLGLGFTLIVVLPAPSTGKSLLADLFLGRVENPQYLSGRVDAKMALYMLGAIMLMLNTLSFAAYHHEVFGKNANPGVYLHTALFAFFVIDYLFFERAHLYTYDLFAEKMGFKLGWGCLVFYPYFYSVGLWGTAHLAAPAVITRLGWGWLVLSTLVFLSGWILARGANMQKYLFKRFPDRAFLGWIEPKTLSGGNLKLLCNGFWSLSRHINYLGEILMATGLALSLGHLTSPWPWLYPFYYILLLVPRERDDDRRCAEKYGVVWEEYRAKVRYRIIPKIY